MFLILDERRKTRDESFFSFLYDFTICTSFFHLTRDERRGTRVFSVLYDFTICTSFFI